MKDLNKIKEIIDDCIENSRCVEDYDDISLMVMDEFSEHDNQMQYGLSLNGKTIENKYFKNTDLVEANVQFDNERNLFFIDLTTIMNVMGMKNIEVMAINLTDETAEVTIKKAFDKLDEVLSKDELIHGHCVVANGEEVIDDINTDEEKYGQYAEQFKLRMPRITIDEMREAIAKAGINRTDIRTMAGIHDNNGKIQLIAVNKELKVLKIDTDVETSKA